MWLVAVSGCGEKKRDPKRDLWETKQDLEALYSPALLSSTLVFSVPCSTLFKSSLLCSSLLCSSLLYSSLLYTLFSILTLLLSNARNT